MTQQPPIDVTVQPYYVRRRQDWAIDNTRQNHRQVLYAIGEPALFTLMWKIEDYNAGLVDLCPRCRMDPNSIEGRIQKAYKQPLTARCPVCYGTTLKGGIRAQIVRPTIFTDADEDETKSARGVVHQESLIVESTDDFRSRSGDFVFRKDGSRWQLGHPQRIMVRTGYEQPTQDATSLGYARITASREDETSVAFDLPPQQDELGAILTISSPFPQDPGYEVINGPLIPGGEFQ
jgi:hypothetical protein